MSWTSSAPYSAARSASCCYPTQWPCPSPQPARAPELLRRLAPSRPGPGPAGPCHPGDWPSAQAARPPAAPGWCRDVTRPAEHVTPQMLMQRGDTTPLLLAATRCAIGLAEARGWSAATIAGVFYGLKAVLDGHTGEDLVLLSEVRERVRPRSHSSATRIAEVLAELELLHDDTTAAIRTWIDRRTGELPAGFGRDVRAWLVVLLDGNARTRPGRTPLSTSTSAGCGPSSSAGQQHAATCGRSPPATSTASWGRCAATAATTPSPRCARCS